MHRIIKEQWSELAILGRTPESCLTTGPIHREGWSQGSIGSSVFSVLIDCLGGNFSSKAERHLWCPKPSTTPRKHLTIIRAKFQLAFLKLTWFNGKDGLFHPFFWMFQCEQSQEQRVVVDGRAWVWKPPLFPSSKIKRPLFVSAMLSFLESGDNKYLRFGKARTK